MSKKYESVSLDRDDAVSSDELTKTLCEIVKKRFPKELDRVTKDSPSDKKQKNIDRFVQEAVAGICVVTDGSSSDSLLVDKKEFDKFKSTFQTMLRLSKFIPDGWDFKFFQEAQKRGAEILSKNPAMDLKLISQSVTKLRFDYAAEMGGESTSDDTTNEPSSAKVTKMVSAKQQSK